MDASNINTNKDERNPIMYNDLDGIKYLWFTRNSDNKRNENEDIYTSKFENGRWIIQPFPYNTNNPESITYASSNFIIYYSHKSDITRGSLFFSKMKMKYGQISNQ